MSQPVDNQAQHPEAIHLPSPSIWPMVFAAGFMFVAFGFILGIYDRDAGRFLLPGAPLGAIGLALMLTAVGGWLWGNVRERLQPTEAPIVVAKFAMWCFIGTEVIIFGALIGRVLMLLTHDVTANDGLTQPVMSLMLVSANTFLLLLSSLFVVLGLDAIQHGRPRGLAGWLAGTALLGATFITIQGFEFSKLVSEGLVFGHTQFASAFYFLTGNHGLHVFIGVIWAIVVILRTLRGGFSANEHMGVEIFGLYWHFVDVVWIMIFTLVYLI